MEGDRVKDGFNASSEGRGVGGIVSAMKMRVVAGSKVITEILLLTEPTFSLLCFCQKGRHEETHRSSSLQSWEGFHLK